MVKRRITPYIADEFRGNKAFLEARTFTTMRYNNTDAVVEI